MKHLVMLLIALTLGATLSTGCGGNDEAGGNDGGVTTSSLNKAEYVKQVNETCTRGDARTLKKFEKYQKKNFNTPQKETFAALSRGILIPEAEVQIDEIRELGAPEGDEAEVEALLAAMQKGLDDAKKQSVKSSEQFLKEFLQFDKLAEKYGLDACVFNLRRTTPNAQ